MLNVNGEDYVIPNIIQEQQTEIVQPLNNAEIADNIPQGQDVNEMVLSLSNVDDQHAEDMQGQKKWTTTETQKLLSLVKQNLALVESRKIKNKETMWKIIKEQFPQYTVQQVCNKYRICNVKIILVKYFHINNVLLFAGEESI